MFKGRKILIAYLVGAIGLVYAFVIYKLVALNWFANAGFVTVVIYGFIMLLVPVGLYNLVSYLVKSNK